MADSWKMENNNLFALVKQVDHIENGETLLAAVSNAQLDVHDYVIPLYPMLQKTLYIHICLDAEVLVRQEPITKLKKKIILIKMVKWLIDLVWKNTNLKETKQKSKPQQVYQVHLTCNLTSLNALFASSASLHSI